jgi:hypothetical protein
MHGNDNAGYETDCTKVILLEPLCRCLVIPHDVPILSTRA